MCVAQSIKMNLLPTNFLHFHLLVLFVLVMVSDPGSHMRVVEQQSFQWLLIISFNLQFHALMVTMIIGAYGQKISFDPKSIGTWLVLVQWNRDGIKYNPMHKKQSWKEGKKLKDLKAKSYLFLSIDCTILETILIKETSKGIWELLICSSFLKLFFGYCSGFQELLISYFSTVSITNYNVSYVVQSIKMNLVPIILLQFYLLLLFILTERRFCKFFTLTTSRITMTKRFG